MPQTRQQLLALCLGCTDCIGVYGYDDFLYCKKEISYTTQVDTGINQAIQWRIF